MVSCLFWKKIVFCVREEGRILCKTEEGFPLMKQIEAWNHTEPQGQSVIGFSLDIITKFGTEAISSRVITVAYIFMA